MAKLEVTIVLKKDTSITLCEECIFNKDCKKNSKKPYAAQKLNLRKGCNGYVYTIKKD